MSTPNTCFYEELEKIIPEISPNSNSWYYIVFRGFDSLGRISTMLDKGYNFYDFFRSPF